MLEHIRNVTDNFCQIDPGELLLVGVSGGPDSLCLLDALYCLGYKLIVAHLDHGLRPESGGEAENVAALAASRNLPFVLEQADVAGFANQQGMSLEEAARTLRYRFLFQQARQNQAQAVAVGHTADDQVETTLMHLLRGTGLGGLRGMEWRSLPNTWDTEIPLVRPLLGTWRQQIVAYLETRQLQANLDASNQDRRFYRNRLRLELIPFLEELNPGARQRIWRMAEVLGEEDKLLDSLVDAAWKDCFAESGPGYLAFDGAGLLACPLAIQRRLIRRGIAALRPGLRNIDFAAVERALNFLQAPTRTSRLDLAAGLRLELQENRLWIAAWEAELTGQNQPQIDPQLALTLETPGEVLLPGGWQLSAERLNMDEAVRQQALTNVDPYQCWLDAGSLGLPLGVRARRAGDRFCPLGMGGHSMRLSDFMINFKLPRRMRSRWPLVVDGNQIVWVPGFRGCDPAAIRAGTMKVVHISLVHQ